MPYEKKAFRNQRPSFKNIGAPYGDKPTGNSRGLFPSRKCDCLIHFWSWQELNFIKLAEASRNIVGYKARPERVKLRSGPEWFNYVPHFEVSLPAQRLVVELSHLGRATTSEKQTVAELATEHYRRQHITFVEVPHCVVRANPRMQDANFLLRYLPLIPDVEQIIRAHDALWLGPLSIRALSAVCRVNAGFLVSMIRTGELSLASIGPLTWETLVGLPQEEHR